MAYSHFFFIEDKHIAALSRLFRDAIDGAYIVLASSRDFSDIAQYSEKYQNVKVITVRTDNLDERLRIA